MEDGTCVVPLDEIGESARTVYKSHYVSPLLLTNLEGMLYAYTSADEDLIIESDRNFRTFEWVPLGHLRYGTRPIGAVALLKWLRNFYFGLPPVPDGSDMPRRPHGILERMIDHLKWIHHRTSDVIRVACAVEGTLTQGVVRFITAAKEVVGEIGYLSAERLVSLLRTPYDSGIPLGLGKMELTWNPKTDITYPGSFEFAKQQVSST